MKYIYLLALCFFLVTPLQAQYKTPKEREQEKNAQKQQKAKERKQKISRMKEKWVPAGNFSATFEPLFVEASPALGYKLTPTTTMGLGFTYQYFKTNQANDPRPAGSSYGGRVYVQQGFLKYFMLQGEMEAMRLIGRDNTQARFWQYNPLAGMGLSVPLSNQGTLIITGLYNFSYDPANSQYPSPFIVRIGFALQPATTKKK